MKPSFPPDALTGEHCPQPQLLHPACNFLTTRGPNHGQSIKAYILVFLFCEAFSVHPNRNYCHFFVLFLHLACTVLVLDKFIILQLPLSLSYKVMFLKTLMVYKWDIKSNAISILYIGYKMHNGSKSDKNILKYASMI